MPGVRAAALVVVFAVLLVGSGRAAADPSADDRALATVLFREGRALMAQGKIPDACLKLEESERLDPSGGTILNLALCYEQQGQLALSWSEFNEAIAFARRDRRGDREAEATEHAAQLEARLSRLTVLVPDAARVDGLRIERDGHELGRASWALAMPVDGGAHVVRATAPGRAPFSATVELPREGGVTTVEIPLLAAASSPPSPPSPPLLLPLGAAPSLLVAPAAPPDHHTRRMTAWIVGGAGLAQLVAAGYFGLHAASLKAQDDSNDAILAADRSTVLTITGLVTTGVGVYLFLTSRPPPRF